MIQALFSRSDRRLAPVIAAARGRHESLGGWKAAYRQVCGGEGPSWPAPVSRLWDSQLPPPWESVIHDRWQTDRVLPWAHLQGPLPLATLVKHRLESLAPVA